MRNFVYKVTPRGLEQQLMDACEESTRSIARSLQHTEIYGLRTDMHTCAALSIRSEHRRQVQAFLRPFPVSRESE